MLSSLKRAHTPLYASPQQKRGEPPDPRDDVHALGVIWYQMLVGGFSVAATAGSAWKRTLIQRGLSERLLGLLESCFDSDAEYRPGNAAILAERIAEITKSAPIVPSSPPSVPARSSEPEVQDVPKEDESDTREDMPKDKPTVTPKTPALTVGGENSCFPPRK